MLNCCPEARAALQPYVCALRGKAREAGHGHSVLYGSMTITSSPPQICDYGLVVAAAAEDDAGGRQRRAEQVPGGAYACQRRYFGAAPLRCGVRSL